ncbi:MAG: hypothetical protein C0597_11015 [Marinilabiliales bacterium]|nr:MAG: hypothetical protein C0597_11015 [Marinilabiliales bacterium]
MFKNGIFDRKEIMKKYILSLAVLFFLASCQEHKSRKQEQSSENHIQTELSKDIKNNTIFLGLRFGMGGEEVHNYFKDLVSQEKLQLIPHEYISDKGKIYIYKFDFGEDALSLQNVLATFKTYYLSDKLYKLRISVESDNDSTLPPLKSKLKEVYVSKYGQKYVTRENIYNNSQGYVWMDGNTMIEINEGLNKNILIIYTDLVALKDNEEKPREKLMREL